MRDKEPAVGSSEHSIRPPKTSITLTRAASVFVRARQLKYSTMSTRKRSHSESQPVQAQGAPRCPTLASTSGASASVSVAPGAKVTVKEHKRQKTSEWQSSKRSRGTSGAKPGNERNNSVKPELRKQSLAGKHRPGKAHHLERPRAATQKEGPGLARGRTQDQERSTVAILRGNKHHSLIPSSAQKRELSRRRAKLLRLYIERGLRALKGRNKHQKAVLPSYQSRARLSSAASTVSPIGYAPTSVGVMERERRHSAAAGADCDDDAASSDNESAGKLAFSRAADKGLGVCGTRNIQTARKQSLEHVQMEDRRSPEDIHDATESPPPAPLDKAQEQLPQELAASTASSSATQQIGSRDSRFRSSPQPSILLSSQELREETEQFYEDDLQLTQVQIQPSESSSFLATPVPVADNIRLHCKCHPGSKHKLLTEGDLAQPESHELTSSSVSNDDSGFHSSASQWLPEPLRQRSAYSVSTEGSRIPSHKLGMDAACDSPESGTNRPNIAGDTQEQQPGNVDDRGMITVHPSSIPPGTKKFYAVRKGRVPGVYFEWSGPSGANAQVSKFSDAVHKKFGTLEQALEYVNHRAKDCDERCCLKEREQVAYPNSNPATAPAASSRGQIAIDSRSIASPVHHNSSAATEVKNTVAPGTTKALSEQWPAFVQRALALENQRPGISVREVTDRLKRLKEGMRQDRHKELIDWVNKPLPQELIGHERSGNDKRLPQELVEYERSGNAKSASEEPSVVPVHMPCKCGLPTSDGEDVALCHKVLCLRAFHPRCVVGPIGDAHWLCDDCSVWRSEPVLHPNSKDREPSLCLEQLKVVRLATKGNNVFLTGAAGTGKSATLKAVVKSLRHLGNHVDIVAPSGIAALAVGGTTIHTFAHWNLKTMEGSWDDLLAGASEEKRWKALRKTDVLVIEEISMVENFMFTRLDGLLRQVRSTTEKGCPSLPFGGVQIVALGDFCQLPPVDPFEFCLKCKGGKKLTGSRGFGRRGPYSCEKCSRTWKDEQKWAFCSKAWEDCDFKYVELKTIYRQIDPSFHDILHTVRSGAKFSDAQEALIFGHESDVEQAVRIFTTNHDADRTNEAELAKLETEEVTYDCIDSFMWHHSLHPELEDEGTFARVAGPSSTFLKYKHHRFRPQTTLKKNMLVILQANLDLSAGLANGSQGRIVDFEASIAEKLPRASKHGKDCSRIGERLLTGDHKQWQERQVSNFIHQARKKVWPVVEFSNGVKRLIHAHCEITELGDDKPYSIMSRTQIPLVAGWAITAHKSQGMTLDKAIVELSRSWEPGQAYVAMSRARSLEGLSVLSLPTKLIRANRQVSEFMKEKFSRS